MFRRLFFLRAESAAVRLRHSGHMLPASEVGWCPQRNRIRSVLSAFWRRASSSSRSRVVYKAVKRGSNQIKLYFPTYINTNMLYMMKYTYWKKDGKEVK